MVKEISLTQGQVALVDDEDYEWLNKFKWHAAFYSSIGQYYAIHSKYMGHVNGKRIPPKTITMARLIMNPLEGLVVDHINHDTLDNRKKNLRVVSQRQNCQNRKDKVYGSSKFPGVSWAAHAKLWKARIRFKGKYKYLGYFKEERDAAKAYEKACRELFGEELVCKLKRRAYQ